MPAVTTPGNGKPSLADAYPQLATQWHPTLNGDVTPADILPGSNTKFWWQCKNWHDLHLSPNSITQKRSELVCSVCSGRTLLVGYNDFATRCPELVAEWSLRNNSTPDEVTATSTTPVIWEGRCGHEWSLAPGRRLNGQGCPVCAGRAVLPGVNDFSSHNPELVPEWHPNNKLLPTEVTAASGKKVQWRCPSGHEWEAKVASRTNGSGCPVCAGHKVLPGFNDLATTHPELAAEWHPTKNVLSATEVSKGSHESIWWVADCGHEWDMPVQHRTAKKPQGCPYCSSRRRLAGFNDLATHFPAVAAEWHPTKNGTLRPHEIGAMVSTVIWWLGSCKHEWDAPVNHRTAMNAGCPYCSGKRVLAGFNDLATQKPATAAQWHPTKNEFRPTEVTASSKQKVWWLGDCGHEWQATIDNRTKASSGCPVCSNTLLVPGINDFHTKHPAVAALWHPTKNSHLKSPSEYPPTSSQVAVWVSHSCSHEWTATIRSMTLGTQCLICQGRQVLKGFNDLATTHPAVAATWHPTRNNSLAPTHVTFGSNKRIWWICSKKHEWQAIVNDRAGSHNQSGCPQCKSYKSKAEIELNNYLNQLGVDTQTSVRNLIKTTLNANELDIYAPEHHLAIEYNGIYWHTEDHGKTKNYHHDKWKACKEKGIQLIQVWEDEWNRNPEQVKRMLAHKLSIQLPDERRVMARKTQAKEITKQQAETFLNKHHIQGYANGTYYLGLVETGDIDSLVAVLVLKKEASTEGKTLNIIRYATAATVPGGFTKLLKHAEREYEPDSFITFSDNCVSDGGLYRNNGFIADKELPPDYMYVVGNERKHKFNYRLKRFRDDPTLLWREGMTERELATLNNLPRIWDAGKTRWIKKL